MITRHWKVVSTYGSGVMFGLLFMLFNPIGFLDILAACGIAAGSARAGWLLRSPG